MLTTEPTSEMIAEWKRIFEAHRSAMKPNRKSGNEVDRYFRMRYPYQEFDNAEFKEIVALNIMDNGFSGSKLPEGALPNIQSYRTGNVLVGIDLTTGEFHIESEDENEFAPIFDDLFAYRGLDAEDLKNYFLVAQYIQLTQN